MVRCMECGTWIKNRGPLFCYGCGTIKPKVEAHLVGTYQTAVHYMYDAWHRRNKGSECGREFCISTKRFDDAGAKWRRVISQKVAGHGSQIEYANERELIDWEVDYLFPKGGL